MKLYLERSRRDIPDEELLQDLKKVSVLLGKDIITTTEYNKYGTFRSKTLSRRLGSGSWFNVLELAGLEPSRNKQKISRKELFDNLEVVWKTLERHPKYDEMRKPLSKYPVDSYTKFFGTWRRALEEFVEYYNSLESSNENIQ